MKPFSIGQLVQVTTIAALEYADDRRFVATHAVEPFLAVVTGQVRMQTGRIGGSHYPDSFSGEYDPPHLIVDKVVTLWEVRAGMLNKPVLVRDEDLEPVVVAHDYKFVLPRIAVGIPHRLTWLPMDDAPRDRPIIGLVNGEECEIQWAEQRRDPGNGYYGPGWEDTYNHYYLDDEEVTGWRES